MEKLRNLSLRKTIILYMAAALVCAYFLSAPVMMIAERAQRSVWQKYADEKNFGIAEMGEIKRPVSSEMAKEDIFVSELCDFLQTYTILFLSMAGSCVAVWLFYRNKLKKPIAELESASQKISENNLDFQIIYENKDEMGRLCHEFERMRKQLVQNNRELWRMIEEEKIMRAAVSHDIRSPLSILRGYQEMLIEYLPDETIDMNRAMEMLTAGMAQIERMDVFTETMQKMSSLDQRELRAQEITAEQLKAKLWQELHILEKASDKQCVLRVPATEEVFCGDREVILEVADNLLSNALRYAKKQVEVSVRITYSELKLRVSDDGDGFGGDEENLTKAFHQQNVKDSLRHTGLGMYISRLYCEKHGGGLFIDKNERRGAGVTAVFCRIT